MAAARRCRRPPPPPLLGQPRPLGRRTAAARRLRQVALGTDQLTYTADDPITHHRPPPQARPLARSPIPRCTPKSSATASVVATVPLAPVEGSNGLHEGKAAPIRIARHPPSPASPASRPPPCWRPKARTSLTTSFRVIGAAGRSNWPTPRSTASCSKKPPPRPAARWSARRTSRRLLPLFLTEGTEPRGNPRNHLCGTMRWFSPLLAPILTTEWWLRRSGGLP